MGTAFFLAAIANLSGSGYFRSRGRTGQEARKKSQDTHLFQRSQDTHLLEKARTPTYQKPGSRKPGHQKARTPTFQESQDTHLSEKARTPTFQESQDTHLSEARKQKARTPTYQKPGHPLFRRKPQKARESQDTHLVSASLLNSGTQCNATKLLSILIRWES